MGVRTHAPQRRFLAWGYKRLPSWSAVRAMFEVLEMRGVSSSEGNAYLVETGEVFPSGCPGTFELSHLKTNPKASQSRAS